MAAGTAGIRGGHRNNSPGCLPGILPTGLGSRPVRGSAVGKSSNGRGNAAGKSSNGGGSAVGKSSNGRGSAVGKSTNGRGNAVHRSRLVP
ncbi:hypothetical protein SRABI26_03450 [Arthrobacter sp. Bi26]|nr:hypothetical protein SRABI26_03450 [Arthrobacter sp. Bi26]